MKFVVCSDTHLASRYPLSTNAHPYKDAFFISAMKSFAEVIEYAKTNKCAIIHAGDWFDSEKLSAPEFKVTDILLKQIENYNLDTYVNLGNHEIDYLEGIPSTFQVAISNNKNISYPDYKKKWDFRYTDNFYIYMIPYCEQEEFNERIKDLCKGEIQKPSILIIHQNIKGIKIGNAILNSGIGEEEISKMSSKFSVIICGHLHNGFIKGNLIVPGSTIATSFKDLNSTKSFIELDIKEDGSFKIKVIPIKNQIKFIEDDFDSPLLRSGNDYRGWFIKINAETGTDCVALEKELLDKGAIGVRFEFIEKKQSRIDTYARQVDMPLESWLSKYLQMQGIDDETEKMVVDMNKEIFK